MLKTIFIIPISLVVTGCATIIKGYESPVELYYSPDSLQVYTINGEKLPIKRYEYKKNNIVQSDLYIELRSNASHVLRIVHNDKQKVVSVYPKLSLGWFLLDIACGGFPVFIDMYTGAWHHFDDINAHVE